MTPKKHLNKIIGPIYVIILFLIPYILIGVFGWEKICIRLISVFLLSMTAIIFFVYWSVMPYPGAMDVNDFPKEQQPIKTKKRKVFRPYVRVLLLGLSVAMAWGFMPFYKDVVSIVFGKQGYETIRGKITNVKILFDSAFIFKSIQLNGNKDDTYEYLYSFSGRMPVGAEYEFIFLKNSKFIVDDVRLGLQNGK